MTEDLQITLRESSGSEFFDVLEKVLKLKIPVTLKNVLTFNRYDSAYALGQFNDDSIHAIQDCMRNVFEKDMREDDESVADYLGKFTKVQQKFIFLSGELKLIKTMAETCQRLYVLEPVDNSSHEESSSLQIGKALATKHNVVPIVIYGWTLLDQTRVGVDISVPDDTRNNLFNVIGSHMITIFNDAKRITLSGWSWPSRYVAAEMANNFKLGRSSPPDINLQYVTPVSHREFLDCIVVTDIENLKVCIRESLAMSLRVDGSVDRTQKHNVFVMIQIVKKDASMGTLCLGFDIPKTPGAEGYLNCLQKVVKKVLPWDESFKLITSIVTDGESLNMGHLNGLVAKLKALRNLEQSNLPLLSIWCVAHRTNLAWKSVSNVNIIASIITRARKLSKHFHDSGKRTSKLNDVAALNGLTTPLRYPSFFAVRWVEFVFNLFNAILRNWRASILYFKAEKLTGQLNQWIQYDTLHCITFVTDVLLLIKKFQKSCQSDTITLIDVERLSNSLYEKLENCKVGRIEGGWEEFFLQKIVINGNNISLCGIELKRTSTTRTRRNGIEFNANKRKHIIQSLLQHLKVRLDLDVPLLTAFKPLVQISSSTSQESIKLCHQILATDFEENNFVAEYYATAELLNGKEFSSTLETLQILIEISPDPNELHTIKVALARISVAKPHSADVERLINIYNKFKDTDRTSLSQDTLSNYLYINTNMGTLEKFDPAPAANYWLGQKKRHPKRNTKAHQQEWFHGVFDQPPKSKQISPNIKF